MKTLLYLACALCSLVTESAHHRPEKPASIFLSLDNGDSWTPANTGLPPSTVISTWVLLDNTVVAATEKNGIFVTDNQLKTWNPSNTGLPDDLKIKSLIKHNQSLFAGCEKNGVYASYDTGNSWQKASEDLNGMSVRALYSLNNIIYAGTDAGIYRSTDNGASWKLVAQGLQINAFTAWDNTIYAATNLGILRSESRLQWNWFWQGQALFNISADNGIVASLLPENKVLRGDIASGSMSIVNAPFMQYTFRPTPASEPILLAPWQQSFRSLREKATFQGQGLPQDVSFQKILSTPFGILIAEGYPDFGC